MGAGSKYWETMENVYKDKNNIYSAQSLLYTYKVNADLDELETELKSIGYHFSIKKNGELVYSNLTDPDKIKIRDTIGDVYEKDVDLTIVNGDLVIIKESGYENGAKWNVAAIHDKDIYAQKDESYMRNYAKTYIGFMIGFILLAVVLVNILFAYWVNKTIIKPIKTLSRGASNIKEGELNFEIKYDKNNEIGQFSRDFDDMRRYLEVSVQEREEFEEYKKHVILGISHDLRTPLTSIRGYMEGIRDGIPDTESKRKEYFDAMETSISNLTKLVENLTTFSGMSMGEYHISAKKTDLNSYFKNSVKILKKKFYPQHVNISFKKCHENVCACIDKDAFDRISTNIIENSIKYREKITSEIIISVKKERSDVIITYSDDGKGVDKKDLEKIFMTFYRGDVSRNNPQEGTGIGLAVVKQSVEMMNGSVTAENDNGLKIMIRLPIVKE